MARADIAATRAVMPHVRPDGVDWLAVRLALTMHSRRLANGQALQDIFEEEWEPILASIHREIDLWLQVDENLGTEATLRLLSIHGSHTESIGEWWGSGWYEMMVRRAVSARRATETCPRPCPASSPMRSTSPKQPPGTPTSSTMKPSPGSSEPSSKEAS
ncbi:hypothetical protein ACIRQY_23200 [Streptomyces sp. NPDC101490]|uniref:hypothetical protein n=1 Tax=Streptomyces sp. NPDC101490 TaxID=3366143 RepID=UPI0037FA38B0